MKKIVVRLLAIILLIQAALCQPLSVAFAEETETEVKNPAAIVNKTGYLNAYAENYSDIKYFEFVNPYKIATSAKYIAVIENKSESAPGRLLLFTIQGSFVLSQDFRDPRDVEIIGDKVFVLDYNEEEEKTYVYGVNAINGEAIALLSDIIVYDIATDETNLYCLIGSFARKVARYKIVDDTLIADEEFSTGTNFSNATMITASKEYVLAYQTNLGISVITALNLSSGRKIEMTSLPSGGITDFCYNGEKLFIINQNGCFAGNLAASPDFVAALGISSEPSFSGNIKTPVSIAASKANNKTVYILDGKDALAVKGFSLSQNILLTTYFSIASFSADEGAFNTPKDLVYSNGKTYYADSLNMRITVRSDSGKNSSFKVVDSKDKTLVPLSVGVDYYGNIYVATSTKVLKYSSSFELADEYTRHDSSDFRDVTSVFVSDVSDDVYVVDGARLAKLNKQTNSFNVVKSAVPANKAFTYDDKFERIYLISNNIVTVFDARNFNKIATLNVERSSSYVVKDVFADFDGSVYALVEFMKENYLYKFIKDGDKYVDGGSIKIVADGDALLSRMTFDAENKCIYFIADGEHRAYLLERSDFRDLKVAYYYDLSIPKDIFDGKEDREVSVGTVVPEGNGLIYPLNPEDSLYPVNYSFTRARKLSSGEKVVVAGKTSDENYVYVIYNNAAGFMDAKSVSTENQYEDVPYGYGVALHENVYLYKYPLITTYGLKPLYAITPLKKDTALTIINRASDYLSPSGLYWYYVSYVNDAGETVYGYIPRYNTVENTEVYNPEIEYGKINAELLHGYVEVYADLGQTKLGINLPDKTRVEIIDKSAGDYVFIREVTENGDGVVGYVKKSNVTYDAQTKSTTTALVLIGVLIIVVALLIVAKVVIAKYKRKRG